MLALLAGHFIAFALAPTLVGALGRRAFLVLAAVPLATFDLFQRIEADDLPAGLPRTMVGATLSMVGLSLSLALLAGPLFAFTERASADLLERTPYITAVLPEDLR